MLENIKSSVLKSKNISPFLVPSEHHTIIVASQIVAGGSEMASLISLVLKVLVSSVSSPVEGFAKVIENVPRL